MKFISLCVLISFSLSASSQVPADAPLPSNGESVAVPPAVDGPPVQDKREFNSDIDDFEKKISKEVPAEKNAAPDKAAEKARTQMKKQLSEGGPAETGIAKHKKEMAAKRADAKKTAKSSKAAKKSKKSATKNAKKKPAKKKKSEE